MSLISDFKKFVAEQKVVGFAVAFVLATAVADFVKKFLDDMVYPFINKLIGMLGSSTAQTTFLGKDYPVKYGDAITALIGMLATFFVIFVAVKKLKLDKLDK